MEKTTPRYPGGFRCRSASVAPPKRPAESHQTWRSLPFATFHHNCTYLQEKHPRSRSEPNGRPPRARGPPLRGCRRACGTCVGCASPGEYSGGDHKGEAGHGDRRFGRDNSFHAAHCWGNRRARPRQLHSPLDKGRSLRKRAYSVAGKGRAPLRMSHDPSDMAYAFW
jgi:hypothetical protein